jgi:aspartate beta-hydroxylase
MITNIDTDNNSPFLNIPFLPRSDHPGWCKVIEDNWEKILKELLSLNPSGKGKHSGSDSTWTVVGSGERGSGGDDHRVVSAGGKWTEYVLFGTGSQISDSDVPFTKKLLRECASDAVSLAESGGGEVIFSRLAPKTHIEAHCGPTNLRLTCHLGLVVPKSIVGGDHLDDNDENDDDGRCGIRSGKCQIRVGTSWYTWKTGKVIVFDDSWEHEVLNDTDEERIVLLLRFWHPSLKCGNERDHHLRAARQGKESAVIKRYHPPD